MWGPHGLKTSFVAVSLSILLLLHLISQFLHYFFVFNHFLWINHSAFLTMWLRLFLIQILLPNCSIRWHVEILWGKNKFSYQFFFLLYREKWGIESNCLWVHVEVKNRQPLIFERMLSRITNYALDVFAPTIFSFICWSRWACLLYFL